MPQTLLFIGHTYHLKTRSTDFLQDILRKQYEVELFTFDPHVDDIASHFRSLTGKRYDVVVCLQVMPDMDAFRQQVVFSSGVFFPMYDGIPALTDPIWQTYRDILIISFSKTLHVALQKLGFESRFIQYFPQPGAQFTPGDSRSVFFWQRVSAINVRTLEVLFKNQPVDHIHVHKALDPGNTFIEPTGALSARIVYSQWYPQREDLLRDMERSAYYVAPRLFEGIGMSFLEAMAMGRCVVAPDNPTMNEYIEHGVTGILYDVDNLQPLASMPVERLQRNAQQFIHNGYLKWTKEKKQIPEWIADWKTQRGSARTTIPLRQLKRTKPTSRFLLFGFFPVLGVAAGGGIVVYRLFGFLPLFVKTLSESELSIWLFGLVRIFKTDRQNEWRFKPLQAYPPRH